MQLIDGPSEYDTLFFVFSKHRTLQSYLFIK